MLVIQMTNIRMTKMIFHVTEKMISVSHVLNNNKNVVPQISSSKLAPMEKC